MVIQKKPIMPPNCRDFYKDLGVCNPDGVCNKIINPINYTIRVNFAKNNISEKTIPKKNSKEKSRQKN